MTLDEYLVQAGDTGRLAPMNLRSTDSVAELVDAGMTVIRQDLPKAKRLAQAARSLANRLNDQKSLGLASRLMGHVELLGGRAKKAIPHYIFARASFVEFPEERAATAVAMLQALAYIGDYDQAFEIAAEALEFFKSNGDTFRAARVEANLANALHRLDRLQEAKAHYSAARPVLAEAGAVADLAIVTRNYGVCLMGLLEFDEAERHYADARKFFEKAEQTSLVFEIELNQTYLLGRKGRLREALEHYRRLITQLPGELGFEVGHCFLDQADFMLDSGLWTDASDAAQRAAEIFRELGAKFELGKALYFNGVALVRSRQLEEGYHALKESRRFLRTQSNSNWQALLQSGFSELWMAKGQTGRAFKSLFAAEAAGPSPERKPLIQRELSFLALEVGDAETYGRLPKSNATRAKYAFQVGNNEEAISAARAALAEYDAERSLLEATRLRQGAALARSRDLRECFRVLREPAERLGVVVRLKNQTLAETAQSPEALPFVKTEQELREAKRLMVRNFGSTRLPLMNHGETLIEFFSDQDRLLAFLITEHGVEELDLGPIDRYDRAVRMFRFQLGRDRGMGDAGVKAAMTQLRQLFAPLFLSGETVWIGRGAPLHAIPFHAIFEENTVGYTPNASMLAVLQNRESGGTGVLITGVGDDTAPLIQTEIDRVSKRFEVPPTLPAEFERNSADARWIHIAAHGIAREDRPLLSAMKLGEVDLAVLDVVRLRLQAELVTLSGCSTGISSSGDMQDSEGFIEAFLGAGANTVLASLWEVSDEATLCFMDTFYENRDSGHAEAFRRATLRTKENYPHPADWAAFALFGNL